jgi:hypothetical protein
MAEEDTTPGGAWRGPVHMRDGYLPAGNKYRACCSCGYTTTPRVSETRARHALLAAHQLTDREKHFTALTKSALSPGRGRPDHVPHPHCSAAVLVTHRTTSQAW